jgi:hypothetical protein
MRWLFLLMLIAACSIGSGLAEAKSTSVSAGSTRPNNQVPKPVSSSTIADKWALIVGISSFDDKRIPSLSFAAKDARDFRDFLITKQNFASDHVRLLTDRQATRANILAYLGGNWLPRRALPKDLVVLFFSTHGSPSDLDVADVNYLVASDTDIDNLYGTGIPMQELARMIKARVHSERVVMFLDACHSGATDTVSKGLIRTGNVNVDAVVQGTGQLVISSSTPSQRSWESKRGQNGVYTRHLMEALNKRGNLTTLGEAYEALKSGVESEVLRDRGELQTPLLKSKWSGNDLVLGSPASQPRAAEDETSELPSPQAASPAKSTSAHGAIGYLDRDRAIIQFAKAQSAAQELKIMESGIHKVVADANSSYAEAKRQGLNTEKLAALQKRLQANIDANYKVIKDRVTSMESELEKILNESIEAESKVRGLSSVTNDKGIKGDCVDITDAVIQRLQTP